MAAAGHQLQEQTECCCICLKAFTDPRTLPCIHTFCLDCLKQTADAAKKKPGENMLCPLCRKVFVIPAEGINGIKKNFFMEHLVYVTTKLQLGNKPVVDCVMCKALNEGDEEKTKEATMRCVECRDNFCDKCSKAHKLLKLSKTHNIVKIDVNKEEDVRRIFPSRNCDEHNRKPLDYYCVECKKAVCVSCVVENHASHVCKEVTTVEEDLRQTISKNALKISSFADGLLLKAESMEPRKTDFLLKIEEIEFDIQHRKQELLEMIAKHTKSLLKELRLIKHRQLKEFEKEKEEIERFHTILKSFEAYSIELRSKGSASDVCCCFNEMLVRADELEKDHEAFYCRPCLSPGVSLKVTDAENLLLASGNVIGRIQEAASHFENSLVVVGLDRDCWNITKDAVKINLHRPNEVSKLQQVPSRMVIEAAAAIHANTIYVTGIGDNWDEIWKYNSGSGWVKCSSLIQGRRKHSAAFLDGVLYICGGYVQSVVKNLWNMLTGSRDPNNGVLNNVEAYDSIANSCTTAGKLVHCINNSGNCVPFKSSLYIFGGKDQNNEEVSDVQVYNTKQNTCTLLSKPMPRGYHLMQAALWKTSVILLGRYTCFVFNFETETWEEREQFKTDVVHFGLVLENERVFVCGGGVTETNASGKNIWKCRNDVRYVPLANIIQDTPSDWKIHAKLPEAALVHAYTVIRELVFV